MYLQIAKSKFWPNSGIFINIPTINLKGVCTKAKYMYPSRKLL